MKYYENEALQQKERADAIVNMYNNKIQ